MTVPEGNGLSPPPPANEVRGWHPDPFDRRPERWWDGESWTGYVRSRNAVEWDELPEDADEDMTRPAVPGLPTAAVGFVVGVGLALTARSRLHGEPVWEMVWASIGLWCGLAGAALVASWRSGMGSVRTNLGLRLRWVDVGVGFGASFAARLLTASAAAPMPQRWQRVDDLPRADHPHGIGQWVAIVLVVCVGAPLFEELFFRGLVQPRLVARLGPVVGIGTTALLFGLAHLLGWFGPFTFVVAWVIAVGGGLALGTLRYYSGRLGPSVMAHSFFNIQAVVAAALLAGLVRA
ncbi:MAG: CPBP family intramembrane metalloprotease [Acidobacteria bacterium]|nr:CPBP family intramembrane metalloprotease [Acidobacteriota bacterium]